MLGKSFREGTIVNLVHNGFLGSQGSAERQLSDQIALAYTLSRTEVSASMARCIAIFSSDKSNDLTT